MRRHIEIWAYLPILFSLTLTGCSSYCFRIKAIDSSCIGSELKPSSRNAYTSIDVSQLSQKQGKAYTLDAGDTLAVLLPGIEKDPTEPLTMQDFPVINPDPTSGLSPQVGLPVPVQDDGTIRLPLVPPIQVGGLSITDATEQITAAYVDSKIVTEDKFFPVVSLLRQRTYTVTVVREDQNNRTTNENLRQSSSEIIELPAFQNDVLNALVRTGGLPGLTAKPFVKIVRNSKPRAAGSTFVDLPEPIVIADQAALANEVSAVSPSDEFVGMLASPGAAGEFYMLEPECNPNTVIIPLRVPVGTCPQIDPKSVILSDGDIVYVESREAEVFYTGGLIPGGQHLLPRDYDIDIFEAMAIAGYSYGSNAQNGGGGNGLLSVTGVVPTELFIFRKRPDGCETTIRVDLEDAANDQCQRLIVQSGDKLLLRYSSKEESLNFGIFAFFTFGIRQLFR